MAGWKRGLWAGVLAGTATVGAMELAATLVGLRTLPDVLEEPFLALLPGPLFGFLIDTLQHAGKVLEAIGLLVATVAGLALLGALYGAIAERRSIPYLGLGAGAIAWVAVCGVLLPLAGDGLLGLHEGVTTPIVWAVLAVLYAVLLEMGCRRPRLPAEADAGRRQSLTAIPALAALAGLGVSSLRLVPGWYQTVFAAPESGLTGPVPELTPVHNFYVVSKNLTDPSVDGAAWSLNVHGLVDAPYRLTLAELRALPARDLLLTLECISNGVGGDLISTGRFSGVSLGDLLSRAQPRAGARYVAFRARDGFTESIPIHVVTSDPNVIVAHALDDAPLSGAHGYPARVLIPGRYGMKQPKWLDEIELTSAEVGGYWEAQGWSRDAIVRTGSRIDTPRDGAVLPKGSIPVAGIAFAGTRGIARVEVSVDGGRAWADATLKPPLSQLTWAFWTFDWPAGAEGAHTLVVRATDGTGARQEAADQPSFPSGPGGYHAVRVAVGR